MQKSTRAALAILPLAAAASLMSQTPSQARPPYAKAEGVPCMYCHVQVPKPRNYRGAFYGANKHSFENFDEYAAFLASGAEKPLEPSSVKPASLKGKAPVTAAHDAVVAAQTAYEAKKGDAKLKKAYVDSLTALSKAILESESIPDKPKFSAVESVTGDALALDAKNKAALADKKTADDGLKAEADKEKTAEKAKGTASAAP